MSYLILIAVVSSLIVILKCAEIIVKASKRVNLLYEYFIVNGSATSEDIQEMTTLLNQSRPDPNDGSGCPKESELVSEV